VIILTSSLDGREGPGNMATDSWFKPLRSMANEPPPIRDSRKMPFTWRSRIVEFADGKYSRSWRVQSADLCDTLDSRKLGPGLAPFSLTFRTFDVNFALTIGMLKLRRRLRSTRPARRPLLDWWMLHVPVTACLMGWRERIRR